jgi:hypothetical protein
MKKQQSATCHGRSLIITLSSVTKGLFIYLFLGIFLLAMSLPGTSLAADGEVLWSANGIHYRTPFIVSDDNGGVIVVGGAPSVLCYSQNQTIEINRVDFNGTVTHWDTSAINSGSHSSSLNEVAEDGDGGLLLVWTEHVDTWDGCKYNGVFISRYAADGTNLWGRVQITTDPNEVISMCSDSIGGAYVLRGTTVHHYNSVGLPFEQLDIASDPLSKGIKILSDGRDNFIWDGSQFIHVASGFYVLWREAVRLDDFNYKFSLRAQWINAGIQWGPGGVELVTDIGSGGLTYSPSIKAERNGNNGLFVSWHRNLSQLRIQSINSSGVKQWGPDGTVVVDPTMVGGNWPASINYENTITPDGSGGAILAWKDFRHADTNYADSDIYARRVSSDGTLLWSSDVLLPPTIIDGLAPGTQTGPLAVADGNGGSLITFADYYFTSGLRIALTRISGDGVKLFSQYYIGYTPDTFNMTPTGLIFDNSGPAPDGAIIAWDCTDNDYSDNDVAKLAINNDPPANDSCADAPTIGLGDHTGTLIRATNDGESSCGNSTGQPDVWYRFVAPYSGNLLINTCGTNDLGGIDAGMDTIISVHHEACSDTSDNQLTDACSDDTSICNEEDQGNMLDSAVTIQVDQDDVLLIRISKHNASLALNFKFAINYLDLDSDHDGVLDSDDICPGFDDTLDIDNDGIPDGCDVCSSFNNINSPDCNRNLIPDGCDLDGLGNFENFSGDGRRSFHLNSSAVVEQNACRLTPALNGQMGSIVFDPVSIHTIDSFTLSFDYKVGGGGGADGLSFALFDHSSFNNELLFGEDGPLTASLTIKFNTFMNGADPSENFIALRLNNTTLTTFAPSFDINDNLWRHVDVVFEGYLLTMKITGPDGIPETIFNNFSIPAFTPFVALYGFGARTGALNDEHWVDNIYFNDSSQTNDANSNNIPDDCEMLTADLDRDRDVDALDLHSFSVDYQINANSSCPDGCLSDLNGDAVVDQDDVTLFAEKYGKIIF